jgi:O-antigen/teichoic acid export membrane protein
MTAIGVVTGIITARWLGPHDRGLFQLLTMLPTTLSNFVKLGIPQASVYFMRRKGASASAVASNSVWMALVMGTTLAIVCWFGRDWLPTNIRKDSPEELVAPSLALIPFALQFYLLGVAQAGAPTSTTSARSSRTVVLVACSSARAAPGAMAAGSRKGIAVLMSLC